MWCSLRLKGTSWERLPMISQANWSVFVGARLQNAPCVRALERVVCLFVCVSESRSVSMQLCFRARCCAALGVHAAVPNAFAAARGVMQLCRMLSCTLRRRLGVHAAVPNAFNTRPVVLLCRPWRACSCAKCFRALRARCCAALSVHAAVPNAFVHAAAPAGRACSCAECFQTTTGRVRSCRASTPLCRPGVRAAALKRSRTAVPPLPCKLCQILSLARYRAACGASAAVRNAFAPGCPWCVRLFQIFGRCAALQASTRAVPP